ncbi:MAG: SDR family NAD(P)-dependent oxidoreductase [Bacteroidales bacterium]|nr:SDR family NAD(P)-dependent oxidoreductase [Bacteroidales bacterium]
MAKPALNESNILITGAGGFIGSHLAELCVEQGYQVKAFIHYNSQNSWGWLEGSKYLNEMEIVTGDIRDYDSVFAAMEGCNTVFHLAALIGIPFSLVSPLAYIETNITGTYNILQAARQQKLSNIIITSTSETYGTAQYIPMDEKHPGVAHSPYAASKIAADQMALSFFRSFELPVKIVRPFNTYGPRQSARAIIPTILSQIFNDGNVVKLGNLNPTRDFTFVEDTVNAFLQVAKSDKFVGDVVNIGTNSEVSIGELAKKILQIIDVDTKIVSDVERIRPGGMEVERLRCDNNKILSQTDWKPQYNLEKGLEATISWFRENSTIFKHNIYNI